MKVKIFLLLIVCIGKNSLAQTQDTLNEFKKLPIAHNVEFDDWRLFLQKLYYVNGEIKKDTLLFENFNDHDLPFYEFRDKKNNYYGFILNSSDYELSKNGHHNVKHIVIWRELILKHNDDLEYQDFPLKTNEILFIKRM